MEEDKEINIQWLVRICGICYRDILKGRDERSERVSERARGMEKLFIYGGAM